MSMRASIGFLAAVMTLLTGCSDDAASTEDEQGETAVWRPMSKEPLDTSTTRFTAEVSRLACNSGVTGEVLPPKVELNKDEVIVTFTVAPQDPGGGDCQSNNWVAYPVNLNEPLGERMLIDGACSPGTEALGTAFCNRDGLRYRP
jgi:hypothetical protein